MRTTLSIRGMTCGHCVDAVSTALTRESGVREADVFLEEGEAEVEHDERETPPEELVEAVRRAGYEARLSE